MGPPLVLLVASTATGVAVVGGACVLLKLNSQRRKKNNKSLVNAKGTNGTHKSSNGDTSEEVQRCLQLVQDLGIIPDLSCLKQITGNALVAQQAAEHVTAIVVRDQGKQLGYLPPLVMSMSRLTKLDLAGCNLVQLPWNIEQLQELKELCMSRNRLNHLPGELGSLPALTSLDLSHNHISSVPEQLGSATALTALNLMGNRLTQLPDSIGQLTNLRILGLKSNGLTSLPPSFTRLSSLVELFITDNKLTELPQGFGALSSLVKLQASFNSLQRLPPDMLALPKLELMRVAVCDLSSLPPTLFAPPSAASAASSASPSPSSGLSPSASSSAMPTSPSAASAAASKANGHADGHAAAESQAQGPAVPWPRLAWFSLGGNPACPALTKPRPGLIKYGAQDILLSSTDSTAQPAGSSSTGQAEAGAEEEVGKKLGDGASGEVTTGKVVATGETVAIKTFRSDISPDGRTEEELAIACTVDHPHLTRVRGVLGPEGRKGKHAPPPRLVMDLVSGTPFASKPTSQHLLRCKWAPGLSFTAAQVVTVARGLASALAYLHKLHVCHGDVYAHNLLVDRTTWHATLCDFGASFVYHPEQRGWWEAMEVRAFGLLLHDLTERLAPEDAQGLHAGPLRSLVALCVGDVPSERPPFAMVEAVLRGMDVGAPKAAVVAA